MRGELRVAQGRSIRLGRLGTVVGVWAFSSVVAAALGATAGAVPGPDDIAQRVVAARAAVHVATATVALTLYVHKPITAAPDCTFAGTLRVGGGRPIIQLTQRSPGITCVVVEHRGLTPLFNSLQPLDDFFARFSLSIVDQRTKNGDQYYRVQGQAHDPKSDPHGFIAWIDYDQGTIESSTINYAWGDMRTTETYSRVNGAWILTEQVLEAVRYDATLKLVYSDFGFAPP